MISTAFVNIWDMNIGAVAWDSETGIGSFEFDSKFLQKNLDLAPIMMQIRNANHQIFSFPELRDTQTFKGLPGLLADVLPDKYGNSIINAWLNKQGRPSNSLNPVEMLCFIGKRGMGALEFEPAYSKYADMVSKIEIDNLVEVAEGILSGKKDFAARLNKEEEKSLLNILKIGTSAGGARAKAVIAYNSLTGEVRSGQALAPKGFKHWIIKFDGVSDRQFGASNGYGRVEMAYHLMAKDAGIEMTECRLFEENGRAHFMTRRYDRTDNNDKIHVQSFCAMRQFDFNEVRLYSYEQLFETMRMLALPYPQAEQLFRRMIFNVMGRNCDDHTKNFAFTMDKNAEWKLSPAFDVCHAYRPGSDWVSQHALSIRGKRMNIEKADLLTIARELNIKKPESIINQIAEVISQWEKYAEQTEVETELKRAIKKTLIIL
ncbi:MAG: type II toxin-antitoxin system HipA family toxin [Bacteroidetes bacterium]|nr:MAG: type II toxin-antitoxin system HipA family toxin [Bacteroidota bacterium]